MTGHRPEVLLAMSPDVFDLQFGARELDRLRGLAALGDPVVAHDFSAPAVRRRLGERHPAAVSGDREPVQDHARQHERERPEGEVREPEEGQQREGGEG